MSYLLLVEKQQLLMLQNVELRLTKETQTVEMATRYQHDLFLLLCFVIMAEPSSQRLKENCCHLHNVCFLRGS